MIRVVTAFTPDYATLAERLLASCEYFHVPTYPVPFDSLGDWKRNCAYKPTAILQAMQATGDDCLWLDADMYLLSWPQRFADGDLLVKYSDPPEAQVFDFKLKRNVPNSQVKLTPWGGHLLFRNSKYFCIPTLLRWRYLCGEYGEITNDEQCLMEALTMWEDESVFIGPLNPSFIAHTPAGAQHGKPTAAQGWI